MFTEAQYKALFTDVLDRMLKARWLLRYSYTEGKGFHLVWVEKGAAAACYLKHWAITLGLDQADERPVLASELAHGLSSDPRSVADTIRAAYDPYVAAGLMSGYKFVHGLCSEVYWTEKGDEFCRAFAAMIDELEIELGDEDRLITLVQVVDGWAPDKDTKVVIAE